MTSHPSWPRSNTTSRKTKMGVSRETRITRHYAVATCPKTEVLINSVVVQLPRWYAEQPSWILRSGLMRFFWLSESEICPSGDVLVEISDWELGNSHFKRNESWPHAAASVAVTSLSNLVHLKLNSFIRILWIISSVAGDPSHAKSDCRCHSCWASRTLWWCWVQSGTASQSQNQNKRSVMHH